MDIKNNTNSTNQLEVDTKLLSNAIIELNISRKNITLYPVEHPIIEKAVTRAYSLLQDIFKTRGEISLGISKDTLIIEQSYLDKKNTVYRDFARAMNEKSIASITFKNNISVNDLNSFLTTTSLTSEELNEKGGIKEALAAENISGIVVTEIDYDSFEMTSEDEISQLGEKPDEAAVGLWDSFVYKLMGDSFDPEQLEDDPSRKNELIKVNSKKLAKMVSKTGGKIISQEDKYDEIIADYLREVNKKEDIGDADKKKLIREVADFASDLSPELRKQLLKSTFKTENEQLTGMKDFISDLSNEAILDTLEDINENKLSIPTTIMNLLEKFSQVEKEGKEFGAASESIDSDDVFDLKKEVKELLVDDHQKDYTPDDYMASLNKFVKSGNVKKLSAKYPEQFELFTSSFKDEFIDLRHTIALIEITIKEKKPDMFKMLIDRLSESGIFFTETGQYKSAAMVWNFFQSILDSDKHSEEKKEVVQTKINDIKELKVTDELIQGLRQWGKEKFDEIKDILLMFQELSLKPLLKELSMEENANYRKLYINVISEMDKKAASEIIKYIDHKKWYFVRNIILLIRKLKATEYLEEVRACYGHESNLVKVEVLKALLEFQGNVGLNILKSAIESDDETFSRACVLLAGSYKITDLIPLLLERLSTKRFMSKSNLKDKTALVKALGDMREKKALTHFKKIIKSNSIFMKSNLNELKAAILKSLRKYEYDDIKDIVAIGLKIKDDDIQNLSRQLQ